VAGTYLHLFLAREGLRRLAAETDLIHGTGEGEADVDGHGALAANFYAGVLGPDIGYFPHGPRALSDAIHQYHTADLVRSLHEQAASPAEIAFAAGWALHVYTDLAVHPEIEQRAATLQAADPLPLGTDSWHKRIEWGLDCQTLEETSIRLWDSPLDFLMNDQTSGVLGRAAGKWFGPLLDKPALAAGARSTHSWVRRLAPILLWTGGCRRADRSGLCRMTAAILRPLLRPLAAMRSAASRRDDAAAILGPLRDDEQWLRHLRQLAVASVDDFIVGWSQAHGQLENRHLSSGKLIQTTYMAST
jgi:hypothetical protein